MRRLFDFIDDDFGWPSFWGVPTVTHRYNLYNPHTHELVPRPEYKKELITAKEKEIDLAKERLKELEGDLLKLKE